jgi:predicted NUDIX family NTP pyrophosphohydrolase
MPPPPSAGILLFRQRDDETEVLLIKPGGPYWRNKDAGAWMIPKGMVEPGEAPAEAALREFAEETGTVLTTVPFPLAVVRQSGGKIVEAFAAEGDLDPAGIRSNHFELQWPPRSGKLEWFPEVETERIGHAVVTSRTRRPGSSPADAVGRSTHPCRQSDLGDSRAGRGSQKLPLP